MNRASIGPKRLGRASCSVCVGAPSMTRTRCPYRNCVAANARPFGMTPGTSPRFIHLMAYPTNELWKMLEAFKRWFGRLLYV